MLGYYIIALSTALLILTVVASYTYTRSQRELNQLTQALVASVKSADALLMEHDARTFHTACSMLLTDWTRSVRCRSSSVPPFTVTNYLCAMVNNVRSRRRQPDISELDVVFAIHGSHGPDPTMVASAVAHELLTYAYLAVDAASLGACRPQKRDALSWGPPTHPQPSAALRQRPAPNALTADGPVYVDPNTLLEESVEASK